LFCFNLSGRHDTHETTIIPFFSHRVYRKKHYEWQITQSTLSCFSHSRGFPSGTSHHQIQHRPTHITLTQAATAPCLELTDRTLIISLPTWHLISCKT
jgi:hypothetical protein